MTYNGKAKSKISFVIQSSLTQILALLPLALIYFNLPYIRRLVLPELTEPFLIQAMNKQFALTPFFAVFAALACSIYFYFKWNGFSKAARSEVKGIEEIGSEASTQWQRLLVALGLGIIMQALVLTRCWQFPLTLDDPFIDLRYVQSWASFRSFDYNAGNHIQGYSSALHLAILFVCSLLLPLLKTDIASFSVGLNIGLQICNLLLIFTIVARALKSQILALLAALIYCFCVSSTLAATDGKESALLQILLLCSILAKTFTSHRQWCAHLSVLISLTRPEGILFYLRELITDVVERGKACLSNWAPSSIVLILWYCFVYYYYGSLVPHGALGRASMFHSAAQLSVHSCPFILMMTGMDTFKHLYINLPWFAASPISSLDLQMLFKGAVALLLMLWLSRRHEWLRGYANNCAVLLLFFASFDPWFFSWYYSWFSLVAVFLIPLLVKVGCNLIGSKNIGKKIAGLAIAAIVLLPQVIDLNLINWLSQKSSSRASLQQYLATSLKAPFFVFNPPMQRLALYKHAAEYLNQSKKTRAFSTLATWEPGVLGYYLPETEIIDLGGLISDETLKYYPVPVGDRTRRPVWGSIPTEAVLELKPDRVIFFDCFADNGLLKNQKFLQSYKLVHFWPLELWDGQGLFLFEKL